MMSNYLKAVVLKDEIDITLINQNRVERNLCKNIAMKYYFFFDMNTSYCGTKKRLKGVTAFQPFKPTNYLPFTNS
jgi:hypothetical protein